MASINSSRPEKAGKSRSFRFAQDISPGPMSAPEVGESPFEVSRASMRLPAMEGVSLYQTLRRVGAILYYAIRYFFFSLWSWITIRNPRRRQELRAIRLRESLERLGGMMVKLGQQLSLRMDLLPKVYCDELESLLDRSLPFPTEKALQIIEAQIQKPWSEVFRHFNREPIGVASMACVYEAVLHSGERVAVKVRRPKIEGMFAADFKALDWTVGILEFLTMVRPGVLRNFQNEIREIFLEELDFRIEARYQELFRVYFRRRKHLRVTAPRVFHKLSGREVLVSRYVTGIRVRELKDAVLNRNEAYLETLRNLDINPRVIAKRLVRASYYSFYECPFFHGDPHPANIFVQPGNRIVLVDFGACGVFSAKDREWMMQLQEYYTRGDVGGMVQCVLGLMEPLPITNIDAFKAELLQAWWHGYYGIKSKHAEWWERTSFRLWIALLTLFRKYQLSMPLSLFRMVRATLLYDTVAAQLYPQINVFTEFRKYYRQVTRRSRQRLFHSVLWQLLTGPSPESSFRIEQAIEAGKDLLFQVRRFLHQPHFNFAALPKKIFTAIDIALSFFRTWLVTTIVAVLIFTLIQFRSGWRYSPFQPLDWPTGVQMASLVLLALYLIYIYLYSRKIMFRFRDPDNYNNRRGRV